MNTKTGKVKEHLERKRKHYNMGSNKVVWSYKIKCNYIQSKKARIHNKRQLARRHRQRWK